MDPVVLASLIFSLLVVMLIGGFIVLYPITKRLGLFLESKYEKEAGNLPPAELRELREAIQELQAELRRLAERQEFTDKLLAGGEQGRLARTTEDDPRR